MSLNLARNSQAVNNILAISRSNGTNLFNLLSLLLSYTNCIVLVLVII